MTYSENHCALNDTANWIRASGKRRLHIFEFSNVSASFVNLTTVRSTVLDNGLRSLVARTTSRHHDEMLGTSLSQRNGKTAAKTFETSDDDVRRFRVEGNLFPCSANRNNHLVFWGVCDHYLAGVFASAHVGKGRRNVGKRELFDRTDWLDVALIVQIKDCCKQAVRLSVTFVVIGK
jgi:hypothetical protein